MVFHLYARIMFFVMAFARAEGMREAPGFYPTGMCPGPPYPQFYGAEAGSWWKPDCTGDIAMGATTSGKPCAQWSGPGDTTGEVLCADTASPAGGFLFYRDQSDKDQYGQGKCKPLLGVPGPYYKWRSCGVYPLSP